MSVWKKLNKQDSFVTTYVAKKRWSLSGTDLESAGVKLLPAYSDSNTSVEAVALSGLLCGIQLQAEYIGLTCLLLAGADPLNTCHTELSAEVVA